MTLTDTQIALLLQTMQNIERHLAILANTAQDVARHTAQTAISPTRLP